MLSSARAPTATTARARTAPTIASITASIAASFDIVYPLTLVTDVISFAPSVMMSLTIAMSIDYSLFLLTRFVEEVQDHGVVALAVGLLALVLHFLIPPRKLHLKSVRPT